MNYLHRADPSAERSVTAFPDGSMPINSGEGSGHDSSWGNVSEKVTGDSTGLVDGFPQVLVLYPVIVCKGK